MTESLDESKSEVQIERTVIEAFGYSIIEFEEVLFHKFLISSGSNSVVTPTLFRRYLMRMHAKGYLLPTQFHNKRAWKRLIISDFVDHDVILTETNEPIEIKPLKITSPKEKHEKVREHLVTDCKDIAEEIIKVMRIHKQFESTQDRRARALLQEHIRKMHHALTESKGEFYGYIDTNLPDLRQPLMRILESRGEDKVLLGLQVIRSIP